MFTESRKTNLIEAVKKIDNEDTLIELENVLKKKKTSKEKKVKSAHEFSGLWSKDDAELIEKALHDGCIKLP